MLISVKKHYSATFYYGYHQTQNLMIILYPFEKIKNAHPQKVAGQTFFHTAIKVVFVNHIEIWQKKVFANFSAFCKL